MLQLLGRVEQTEGGGEGERAGVEKRRAERGKQVMGAWRGLPLAASSRTDRVCTSASSKNGRGSVIYVCVYLILSLL